MDAAEDAELICDTAKNDLFLADMAMDQVRRIVDQALQEQAKVHRAEMERMQLAHQAEMERMQLAHQADIQQALQAQAHAHRIELQQLRYDLYIAERTRIIKARHSCRVIAGYVL